MCKNILIRRRAVLFTQPFHLGARIRRNFQQLENFAGKSNFRELTRLANFITHAAFTQLDRDEQAKKDKILQTRQVKFARDIVLPLCVFATYVVYAQFPGQMN